MWCNCHHVTISRLQALMGIRAFPSRLVVRLDLRTVEAMAVHAQLVIPTAHVNLRSHEGSWCSKPCILQSHLGDRAGLLVEQRGEEALATFRPNIVAASWLEAACTPAFGATVASCAGECLRRLQ